MVDLFSESADLRITNPTRAALLREIGLCFDSGHGFTLATLNLDHVVKLRRDRNFHDAYRRHSHVVADGNPIVWLSRLAGHDVELVPGCELIDPIAALAAERNVPVALVGSTDAVLAKAGAALRARFPGLTIAVRIAPPFGIDVQGEDADRIIDQIEETGARVCFLALGAPKQEILAVRAAERLPSCGFVSVGAGLDFIAGAQQRAPAWIRRLSMEWLWRLGGNPRRLTRRYAACFGILPVLTVSALQRRMRDAGGNDGGPRRPLTARASRSGE
jgi:exopolysaccharide biosynthesis WecB/TagA/CpsF family protein